MNAKRPDTKNLRFHPIAQPVTLKDTQTGQMLRLDGWWKTPEGRTLFAGLSAPGTILRDKRDIEIAEPPSSERRSPADNLGDIHASQT